MSHVLTVTPTWRLVHKKLWIDRLVHALTVAAFLVVHALTVAPSRINGRATNKEPVSTCSKDSCSESCAYWGQVCDLPAIRLAPATNSHF